MLAGRTGLDPLLAQVLLNRGIGSAAEAEVFMEPEKQVLPSPLEEFPDLRTAIALLMEAIAHQHKIAICGDYDADGMTSTALLLRALRSLGARVNYAIPSRMSEGYGINNRIVEEFYAEGVRLILTVDNGIAAIAPIARARELGMGVIITDHHDIPPELPPANAILNPKLIAQQSPYWGVAGVGVAYILAVSLAQNLGQTQDLTRPLLELFTLGTIADLAPLTGVNRRWVRRGLSLLPRSQLAGVQALIQVAGLGNEKEALKPEAIGFRLGPRINAVGRLADPQIVIELLTTDDPGVALAQAMQCEQVNQLRQRLCELIEQEAIAWCEQNQFDLQDDRVLVVVHPGWHHGVIGIVASRLVERYGVPVFIGTYEDDDQQEIRGSARGIPEFNVFEALQCCGDLLEKFGGHKAAGGFTLKAENLQEMRSRLRIFANLHLQPQHLKPLVNVDVQASLRDLDLDLYEQIDHLHPCGIENPDPVFWTPDVRIVEQSTLGRDRNHLKLIVAEEGEEVGMKAIAWRWGEYFPLPNRVDIAYKLRLNEWNGDRSVELELVGVRLPLAQAAESPAVEPEKPAPVTVIPVDSPPLKATPTPAPPVATAVIEEIVEELLEEGMQEGADYGAIAPVGNESDLNGAESPESLPKAEFYYNSRKYTCSLAALEDVRELRIRNPDGLVLAVHPHQKRGLLGKRREEAQEVDIAHPHFYNLIRAALNALQIADLSELLKKKIDC
ncbi:MAG TPA: single-stranded-DNA-specific exonuclease RecJ [Synechococcales cyanobacterium M55_K2018_004]|nr:single-stranded-DNA-specific exonuclease RecJ [Synechococcales cyanobacterium M55_K2018_004]